MKTCIDGERLACFRKTADAAFWDEHWRGSLSREAYRGFDQGQLGCFEGAFTRNLPRHGRVLEAGCGIGQYVMALRARGYEAEGVEWATETVEAVKSLWPGLPIRAGDVTRLDVPDGHYGAYVSLGVMEHRRDGPEPFLREAHRVLAPGGVALVSVPFIHRLRILKAALGLYGSRADGLEFYQYAFAKQEFAGILERHGFIVRERIAYDAVKGLGDEVPGLRWMLARQKCVRLRDWLDRSDVANRFFGHMMLYVAVKAPGSVPV